MAWCHHWDQATGHYLSHKDTIATMAPLGHNELNDGLVSIHLQAIT